MFNNILNYYFKFEKIANVILKNDFFANNNL